MVDSSWYTFLVRVFYGFEGTKIQKNVNNSRLGSANDLKF